MGSTAGLKKLMLQKIEAALGRQRFVRRKHAFARWVTDEVAEMVSVQMLGRRDHIHVKIMVGVQQKVVEALTSTFRGVPYDPWGFTVCSYIDTIMRKGQTRWYPSDGPEMDAVVDEILAAIEQHGLPWMRKASTPAGLVSLWRDPPRAVLLTEFAIPVLHHLAGDDRSAEESLREYEVEGTTEDRGLVHRVRVREGYPAFASNLRTHIDGYTGGHTEIVARATTRSG